MAQHGEGDEQYEGDEGHDVSNPPRLMPPTVAARVEETRKRVADHRPLLEVGPAVERDAVGLGHESGDADREEHAEDQGVFWLRLGADAVRTQRRRSVATQAGPDDADEEEHAGDVADGRVALVDATVQELGSVG